MKKTFYLFNPGTLERKDNTLKFTPHNAEGTTGAPRYLPVEGVEELYIFGDLDANSALYNFLGQSGIPVIFLIITSITLARLCPVITSWLVGYKCCKPNITSIKSADWL